MADADSVIQKLDVFVANLIASGNLYTIVIATALAVYLIYPLFTEKDPDTHPFLLARQASASPIRQNGESAVYRAVEIPYGYPLRSGLGVKDPDAPKWSSGRNGDLRDIWRQAVKGPVKEDGTPAGYKTKIITVIGRERVIEHSLDQVTRDINAIGKHLKDSHIKTMAVCLPNSVEFISSFFAAAFSQVRLLLIPHDISQQGLNNLLAKTPADLLVVEAGTVDLKEIRSATPSLKHVIWVTQPGSEHMDWTDVPQGTGGSLRVSVWKELVDEKAGSVNSEVLPVDKDSKLSPVTTFWPKGDDTFEVVEFTSENIIAAVAGIKATLPRTHRLSWTDVVLPVSSLTLMYPLCITLAALFSNAVVALNSVAGDDVDINLVAVGVSPTVVVCSSKSLIKLHESIANRKTGMIAAIGKAHDKQTLQKGIMPATNSKNLASQNLFQLRLLLVSHRVGDPQSPKLSHSMLTDLRLFFGSRIGYALTGPGVAGAVSQTNILDYREKPGDNHFGAPLTCVEIHLSGEEENMTKDKPEGKIVVKGPAVCGGKVELDATGRIEDDNTISVP